MQVKKRMLITIGLLAAFDIGLLAAGTYAVIGIRKTAADISSEQAAIDDRYALRRYVRSSVTNLTDTKKKIGDLGAAAVTEGKELDFVTALESAADSSGVDQKIDLQTVNQKDVSPWEKTIPLNLALVGTYPQILKHLNAVERLPYYITIVDIAVTGARPGEGQDGKVNATVNATVYWQGAKAPDFVRGVDDGLPVPATN